MSIDVSGLLMRVLHVIQTMSSPYGGPVAACLTACRALRDCGVEAEIFTTSLAWPKGHVAARTNCPIEIDGVPVWHFRSWFRPYAVAPRLWSRLRATIRTYDIVHIHGLYRFPVAIAAKLAQQHGIPYIVRPHGSLDPYHFFKPERRRLKRLYERIIEVPNLNMASAIHFTAQAELDLASNAPITARKIVVPLGIDLEKYVSPMRNDFREVHALGDRPLILFMGRLAPQKALDLLAKALGIVVRSFPNVMLLLAGPDHGNYRQQVERWLDEQGVNANAMFLGMVTGEEKVKMLDAADVFVLASYMENFGVSLGEAMAAGCPVVISDRVNIWREVADAEAGLVVPCEADRLAQALGYLLGDPELRRRHGEAGQRLVKDRFEMHATGRLLVECYQEVIRSFDASKRRALL